MGSGFDDSEPEGYDSNVTPSLNFARDFFEMAVLARPTPNDIDESVLEILGSGKEFSFPELEERVKERLPDLANRIQVRQSAWRLVRDHRATVTRDMKVKKTS